jgi:hypothetical protein
VRKRKRIATTRERVFAVVYSVAGLSHYYNQPTHRAIPLRHWKILKPVPSDCSNPAAAAGGLYGGLLLENSGIIFSFLLHTFDIFIYVRRSAKGGLRNLCCTPRRRGCLCLYSFSTNDSQSSRPSPLTAKKHWFESFASASGEINSMSTTTQFMPCTTLSVYSI